VLYIVTFTFFCILFFPMNIPLINTPIHSDTNPILYTADLADLTSKFGIKLHAFADDNQQHVHCDLSNVLSSVNVLEQCITAIGHWMSANRLKLNAEKTELIWVGTRYTIASLLRLHDPTLTLGTDSVKAVHVLGVLFTPDFALEKHVTTVSAKCSSTALCVTFARP